MDTTNREDTKKRLLREHVYSGIKTSIITGELGPHTRLIEEDVAETMRASRTPVREAFQKLEKEGLIYRRPRGGYAVKGVTEETWTKSSAFGAFSKVTRGSWPPHG